MKEYEINGLLAKAIEIIHIQTAEIDRLRAECEVEATDNMLVNSENDELKAKLAMAEDYLNPLPFKNAYDEAIDKAKTEAYKEFAERLRKRLGFCDLPMGIVKSHIEHILTEMESESNA